MNFAKVAESLGVMGIRAETPAEVKAALATALKANRPVVIDAVTYHRAFSPKTWTGSTAAGH
jgi:thiamine pyrophosphate-dependent acetolactate synthase large subunit-like protein